LMERGSGMTARSLQELVDRHAGKPREEVIRCVLEEPQIRQWVQGDAVKRKRLEDEVTQLLGATLSTPRARPVGKPQARLKSTRTLEVRQGRAFMCPSCYAVTVTSAWEKDRVIARCRACGESYEDLLALIPVQQVGPFEFLLGENRTAVTRTMILVLAWLGLLLTLVLVR
jgi:uncharacterized protein (DUF983 family)